MKTYYSIFTLILESDFNERLAMARINCETLRLGPLQTRKYIEALAVAHRNSEETGGVVNDKNMRLLVGYWQKYGKGLKIGAK